jgi:hypothetical protein
MKNQIIALAAALSLTGAGYAQAAQATGSGPAAKPAAKAPAGSLDISAWPVFPGSTLVQQVSMDRAQLTALQEQIPGEVREALSKLLGLQVLEYRLPANAVANRLVEFYEPRALAAGFKVMIKSMEAAHEANAIYTLPAGGLLVLNAQTPAKGERTLQIVLVQGELAGLSALAGLKGLSGRMPGAEAPPAAAPKSNE